SIFPSPFGTNQILRQVSNNIEALVIGHILLDRPCEVFSGFSQAPYASVEGSWCKYIFRQNVPAVGRDCLITTDGGIREVVNDCLGDPLRSVDGLGVSPRLLTSARRLIRLPQPIGSDDSKYSVVHSFTVWAPNSTDAWMLGALPGNSRCSSWCCIWYS